MSEHIEKMVQVYQFNNRGVRVVMDGEDPWFVAKDVCDILGTRTDTVRQIIGNKRVKSINPNLVGVGNHGGKDILIINEAGLYSLVMQSRKPDAEAFQNWVVEDVLPSIRKHGVYMTDGVLEHAKADPAMLDRMIDQLVEDRMRIRNLELDLDIAYGERDIAIRQRGLISRHREATALQRNSALARRANNLERAKMLIEEELETIRPRADRYDQWRSNISSGLRRHYSGDDDNSDQIPLFDYWM